MRLSQGGSAASPRGSAPAPRPGPPTLRLPGGVAFGSRACLGVVGRGGAPAARALPGMGWFRRRESGRRRIGKDEDGEGEAGEEAEEDEASRRARRRAELVLGVQVAERLAQRGPGVQVDPVDPRLDAESGISARWKALRRNGQAQAVGEEAVAKGVEGAEGSGAAGESHFEEDEEEEDEEEDETPDSDASSPAQESIDALFDPSAPGPAPPPIPDVLAIADVEPEDLWWLRRNRYALKARHIREQLPQYDALFRQEEEEARAAEALRIEISRAVEDEERAERAREVEQAQREAAARGRGGGRDVGARPWVIPELWPSGKTPTEQDLMEGIEALLQGQIQDALQGRADEESWHDAQLIRTLAGLPPIPEPPKRLRNGQKGGAIGDERTTQQAFHEGRGADSEADGSGTLGEATEQAPPEAGSEALPGDRPNVSDDGVVFSTASGAVGGSSAASTAASGSAPPSASAAFDGAGLVASGAPTSAWASSSVEVASPSPSPAASSDLSSFPGGSRRLWTPKRGVSPKDPNAEVPERYSESDSDDEWERREAPRYASRPDVEVIMDFVESIGARLVGVPTTALADPGGRSVTALLEAESAARWRFRLSKATPENAMRLLAAEGREVSRDCDRLRKDVASLSARIASVREQWSRTGVGRSKGQGRRGGRREDAGEDGGAAARDQQQGNRGTAAADAAADAATDRVSLSSTSSHMPTPPTTPSSPLPPFSGSLPSAFDVPELVPILFPDRAEDYVDPDAEQPPRAAFLSALTYLRTRAECEAAARGLLRRGDAVVMRAARAHWLYLTFNPRTASEAALLDTSALDREPRIRFKLQSHYPQILDDAVNRLLVTAHFTGAKVSGPVFMPTTCVRKGKKGRWGRQTGKRCVGPRRGERYGSSCVCFRCGVQAARRAPTWLCVFRCLGWLGVLALYAYVAFVPRSSCRANAAAAAFPRSPGPVSSSPPPFPPPHSSVLLPPFFSPPTSTSSHPRTRHAIAISFSFVISSSVSPLFPFPPFPRSRQLYSILRSPHVNKTAQEQYEARSHTRLVDVLEPTPATYAAISRLNMPGGMSSTVMFQAEIDALRARGRAAKERRRRIREGCPTAEDDAVTRRVAEERIARRKQLIEDELERMALLKIGNAGTKAWEKRAKHMADRYRAMESQGLGQAQQLERGIGNIYRTVERVSQSGGEGTRRLAKAYEATVAFDDRRERRSRR